MTEEEQKKNEGIEFLAPDSKKQEKLEPEQLNKLSGHLKFGASEGGRDR